MEQSLSPKTDKVPREFLYEWALWFGILCTFLLLHFSKTVDDNLSGLSGPEMVSNWALPLLFTGLSCAVLSFAGVRLRRAGFGRSVNFLAVFVFFTINVWSLKTGAALTLTGMTTPAIGRVFWGVYFFVLSVSAYIAVKTPLRWDWLERLSYPLLKVTLVALSVSFGAFLLPGSSVPSYSPMGKGNIILVSFDTLSGDHVGHLGYQRDTTPNLDALASESFVFTNFRASFNSTPFALKSMAGYYPTNENGVLQPVINGIFDLLRKKGYIHQAFFSHRAPQIVFGRNHHHRLAFSGRRSFPYRISNTVVAHRHLVFLASLLSEDFLFLWPYTPEFDNDIFWRSEHFPSEETFDDALEFLQRYPTDSFVWVHLWEPHFPYVPDPDVAEKFGPYQPTPPRFINVRYEPHLQGWVDALRDRYDAYLFTVDRRFGRFLEQLKARGLFQNSLLVVTADHGESFSEGFVGHSGDTVVDSVTHVPFLIHLPGQKEQVKVGTPAHQLDIAPTILALLGHEPPKELLGESLVRYIQDPTLVSESPKISMPMSAMSGQSGQIAVRYKNYKLLYSVKPPNQVLLFDLEQDPGKDISSEYPELVRKILGYSGISK